MQGFLFSQQGSEGRCRLQPKSLLSSKQWKLFIGLASLLKCVFQYMYRMVRLTQEKYLRKLTKCSIMEVEWRKYV